MEKKMTFRVLMYGLVSTCLILSGFTPGFAAPKFFSFGGGSSTGVYYFVAAGFGKIMEKYVPDVKFTAESTAASGENLALIDRGKMEFALADNNTVLTMAREGKSKKFRLIGGGYVSPLQFIVREESPIRKVEDFKGQRVGVGAMGSGTLIGLRYIFETGWGMTLKDFRPQYLPFGGMVDGIKDGNIDVASIAAGLPTPSVTDLCSTTRVRFISVPKEIGEKIRKQWAYVDSVIPGGTYPNQPNSTITVAYPNCWGATADLPEELVYQLVKAVYDHPEEAGAVTPSAKDFNLQNVFMGLELVRRLVPYHPGAIKYFKEKGVWKEQ